MKEFFDEKLGIYYGKKKCNLCKGTGLSEEIVTRTRGQARNYAILSFLLMVIFGVLSVILNSFLIILGFVFLMLMLIFIETYMRWDDIIKEEKPDIPISEKIEKVFAKPKTVEEWNQLEEENKKLKIEIEKLKKGDNNAEEKPV